MKGNETMEEESKNQEADDAKDNTKEQEDGSIDEEKTNENGKEKEKADGNIFDILNTVKGAFSLAKSLLLKQPEAVNEERSPSEHPNQEKSSADSVSSQEPKAEPFCVAKTKTPSILQRCCEGIRRGNVILISAQNCDVLDIKQDGDESNSEDETEAQSMNNNEMTISEKEKEEAIAAKRKLAHERSLVSPQFVSDEESRLLLLLKPLYTEDQCRSIMAPYLTIITLISDYLCFVRSICPKISVTLLWKKSTVTLNGPNNVEYDIFIIIIACYFHNCSVDQKCLFVSFRIVLPLQCLPHLHSRSTDAVMKVLFVLII